MSAVVVSSTPLLAMIQEFPRSIHTFLRPSHGGVLSRSVQVLPLSLLSWKQPLSSDLNAPQFECQSISRCWESFRFMLTLLTNPGLLEGVMSSQSTPPFVDLNRPSL